MSEECRFITYKNPPNWLAGDSSDPKVRARRDSYEHRLSRCDGLQDFAELWRKPEQFRDIAAEGGYFPAKAATLTPLLLAGRDDEASTAAVSVINAVDGNSVMGLYSYVTRRNNGPVIGDPPHAVDRPAYDAAWIMSACELGLSCGSGSQLLETICISTGRCGFNSYDEFARQFLNDQQYQQAGQLRGQIVSALRSGGVTFFGLRPRGG